MNIVIAVCSQRIAQRLIETYGINRRRDNVSVFTRPDMLMGVDLAGWLVITDQESFVVPTDPHSAREACAGDVNVFVGLHVNKFE